MATPEPCPSLAELKRLLDGILSEAEQIAVSNHLETCPVCQQQLQDLAAGGQSWEALAEHLNNPDVGCGEHLVLAIEELRIVQPVPTQDDVEEREEISLAFLDPPVKPRQLGQFAHYEIIDVIGRGGMGIVLKALDPDLHRIVALKVMAPQLAAVSSAQQHFLREARAAAAVCHEHVVTIHAVAEAKGLPFLVMQFVAGVSLEQRIENNGPLNLDAILRIGMQTAQGLAVAHAQGLVHRDIKPANILLENGVERVKITDFGLARAAGAGRITQTGVIVGTPQYMAPEQARGEAVDPRADLFSLGSVLYFMSTGQAPFQGDSSLAVLRQVCEVLPPPITEVNPNVPTWLVEIIARLQAKSADDRYQSAGEVAELLSQRLLQLQRSRTTPTIITGTIAPPIEPEALPVALPEWVSTEPRKARWGMHLLWIGALCLLPFLLYLSFPRSAPERTSGRSASGLSEEASTTIAVSAEPKATNAASADALPLIPAPQLSEGKVEVRLLESFAQVRTGGGGRYLVFHLRKAKKLAIFDVEVVKVVKEIDLPTEDIVYACGREKLMIVRPGQRIIQRWSLHTFQREKTAAVPDDRPVLRAVMGSNSRGPLLLWTGDKVFFFDIERMEPFAVEGDLLSGETRGGLELRMSADGQTCVGWTPRISPMNYSVMHLQRRNAILQRSPDAQSFNGHWAMPSADASLFFRHAAGIYDADMQILAADGFKGSTLLPTADPRFFLALRQQNKEKDQVAICTAADRRYLLTIPNLEKMTGSRLYTDWGMVGGEARIHYLPSAKVLLTLPESNDRIVVRPLDLFSLLDKENRDYLFVLSVPPTRVRAGADYDYAMDIRSKAGGVRCRLETGPEGMTVSPNGRFHWRVPNGREGNRTNVIVTVRNASDKEIQHSFAIAVE